MPPRKKKPSFDVTPPAATSAGSTPAGWVYKSSASPAQAGRTTDPGPAEAGRHADPGPAEAGRRVRPETMADRDARAYEVVKVYSLYAAGAGLIPVPAIDIAAIGIVELKMVRALSEVYDVPFSQDRVRPILASMIGGYASTKLGYGAGGALLKAVPLVGPAIGAFAVPGFGAGLTWAIGRVFIQHFASGGTFLNFDPEQVRRYFARAQQPA